MPATQQASKPGSSAMSTEGERLERELWENMRTLDQHALEKKIAQDFQSIHMDGTRNREQELDLIKKLKLGKYTLSNFKTQEHGDTITITYMASADETIDERHLSAKTAPRMSVWRKDKNHHWQLIAHANLHNLGKS